jgi:hypothetical protein
VTVFMRRDRRVDLHPAALVGHLGRQAASERRAFLEAAATLGREELGVDEVLVCCMGWGLSGPS